jgi:hypothetical protein
LIADALYRYSHTPAKQFDNTFALVRIRQNKNIQNVLSLKYRAQKKNTVFKLKFELGARQKGEGEWVKNEGGAFHPEDIAGEAF